MVPREIENNAYAKFGGDKQRALWYFMVFLECSIVLSSRQCSKVYTAFIPQTLFLISRPDARRVLATSANAACTAQQTLTPYKHRTSESARDQE